MLTATTSTPTRSSPSSSSSGSSGPGFGEFLFYDWAKEPGWELPQNPILVAGRNFGCGSSREHAPWALEDYGFQAIIAPSFADIFRSNCTKIGLLPVELPADACARSPRPGEAQVDLAAQEVRWPGGTASVRDRPGDQAPAARRARRHRADARPGGRDRRLRARARAAGTGHDGAVSASSRRRATGTRPTTTASRTPQLGVGPRAARAAAAARRRGRARRGLRLAAGSPRCWPTWSRAAACTASTSPRRWPSTRARRSATGPRPCQDLVELSLPEPVDAVVLERDLPLDPGPRRAVRGAPRALKPGGRLVAQCGGPATSTRSGCSPTRSPARSRSRGTSTTGSGRGTTRRRGRPRDGCARRVREVDAGSSRSPTPEDPGRSCETVCLVRHLDPLPARAARAVRRPRAGAGGRAARARLRAAEHGRGGRGARRPAAIDGRRAGRADYRRRAGRSQCRPTRDLRW